MRAIPRSLLPHSVDVYLEAENADWNTEVLKRAGKLKHVRVEPSSKVIRDKNNREQQLTATLFFDSLNSENLATTSLKEDLIVDFLGDRYRVVSVEQLFDRKRLHHYEMGMIRYAG